VGTTEVTRLAGNHVAIVRTAGGERAKLRRARAGGSKAWVWDEEGSRAGGTR